MNDIVSRYGTCPICGGELDYPEPHTVLTTYPPQIALICKECGHRELKKLTQPTIEPVERVEHRNLLKRVAILEDKVALLEKKVARLLTEDIWREFQDDYKRGKI